jgi:hypothetical protein
VEPRVTSGVKLNVTPQFMSFRPPVPSAVHRIYLCYALRSRSVGRTLTRETLRVVFLSTNLPCDDTLLIMFVVCAVQLFASGCVTASGSLERTVTLLVVVCDHISCYWILITLRNKSLVNDVEIRYMPHRKHTDLQTTQASQSPNG